MIIYKPRKLKKGFTLIELIVVLSILSVGTFSISPNLKMYSDKRAQLEMDYVVEGIIEFINTGKAYGRLKGKNVVIKFRPQSIVLTENLKVIERFELPASISSIALSDGDGIDINGLGQIRRAKSIEVYSKNGFKETITIKVGTSYVSKKK